MDSKDKLLKIYEKDRGKTPENRIFKYTLGISLSLFFILGFYFSTIDVERERISDQKNRVNKGRFIMDKPKKEEPEPKKPEKPEKKKPEPEEPIDLSEADKVVIDKEAKKRPQETKKKKKSPKKVRKVYGVKKVYSKGIGASGNMDNAVIGKQGNTTGTEYDTITPTEDEIKGEVASTVTISKPPSFRKQVKPEYPKEMKKREIEGTVKVKVLIDIDGKVKKAVLLNDLGYGSGKSALETTKKMLFYPAERGDKPVAVWTVIPIRFRLLG
ncbi:MAG: energy transducer TonB [Chitinivibrionales bacterium]